MYLSDPGQYRDWSHFHLADLLVFSPCIQRSFSLLTESAWRLQMLGLAELDIASRALTSLTAKEDITAIHKQIEDDKELRMLYGEAWYDDSCNRAVQERCVLARFTYSI